MADVLIVCVREDEPQAKALADMFEAAGFTIGGAPSNDAALRSSGAGVVVWSQASIRSRPFLDAAQRVINAGKAVVASLIEPPPASSIGSSPAFDLSVWDGDPNDPALDPLFFAVDRMVNSARAAVGGGVMAQTAADEEFEPPPAPAARAAPAARTSGPRRGTSAPAGPSSEDMGAEAQLWRSIRESRDPSDFMDYIARYGPDGAFADVAELRLQQLTQSDRARRENPASRPMIPPRATQRLDPAPTRRADPPPVRRTEPQPPRRMEAPPRRPPIERGYELREPPRSEGGALRAILLIGLLGGAAAAAGLYFGGGLPGRDTEAPANEVLDARRAPTLIDEQPTGFESQEPDSFSLNDVPPPAAARRQPAPRAISAEREPPPPAPVTSWAANNARPPASAQVSPTAAPQSGGPTSLSPGSRPTTSPPGTIIPLVPPPEAEPQPIAAAAPARAGAVSWAQRPSQSRISELYPDRAQRAGVGGRVQLECIVQPSLRVSCNVASETPVDMGFGRAALSAASSWRAQPTLTDGASAVGAQTRLVLNFRPPTE